MDAEISPGEVNMDVEKQDSSFCNATLQPEDAPTLDGTEKEPAPTSDNAVRQPVKRPTRQWAAWTREEEESFFTALRQVGKNFEKITCRVQSKNKDQVRHYYYRLVRRMNKILGSRLCLDAKNSKDTNAAMLKWWSLLEKYSFKASKLHLKPRRFKIFVEALEHQLLKERKKNMRKRSQGENLSPSPCSISSQSRSSAHDNHAIKMVLVDSQNIQKLGPGKPSFKRNVSFGTTHGNGKGESVSVKQPRRRRKPGLTSSSAYKKWEKAAIAGVSLVADAAEHVERTAADAEGHVQADPARSVKRTAAVELINPFVADGPGRIKPTAFDAANHLNCSTAVDAKDVTYSSANNDGQTDRSKDSVGEVRPPLPLLSWNHLMGGVQSLQTCTKLKLQLFPIDDGTRRALEMDKHNPHLELTLSTRKKISSVLEHLNRKWGSSNVARGEIMLFPYGVQQGNLQTCKRWTQDSLCSAADVYSIIGSPPVFRLWYGWFTGTGAPVRPAHESPVTNNCSNKVGDIQKEKLLPVDKNHDILTGSCDKHEQVKNCADETVAGLCRLKQIGDTNLIRSDMDDPRTANEAAISAVEWADSLTNISVGDLLLEVAQSEEAYCAETSIRKNPQCSQQYSISCDSFDAAVTAHMSKYKDKGAVQSTFSFHLSSSIWDAEETCDAFSFQKAMAGNASSGAAEGTGRPSPLGSDGFIEELREVETDARNPSSSAPVEDYMSDDQIITENATKDFSELTDLYWPESLGPLDLDIPTPNYRSEDMILSDSLSCLNRLIATSLDAFQSCSFFGVDKKEVEPTAIESRDNAPFRISS